MADCVERKIDVQLQEYKHQFNMSVLNYASEQETFDLHNKQGSRIRDSIADVLLPWVDRAKSASESVAAMRREYVRRLSDPSSEKGKAAIAEQRRIWKEQRRGKSKSKMAKRQHKW